MFFCVIRSEKKDKKELNTKGNLMEEDIQRAKQYSQLKIWAAIVQFVLTVAFSGIMLVSGASAFLKDLVSGWTRSFYLQIGLYVAIFSGLFCMLFLPLDFYESFLLEHKFCLSNQTVFSWVIVILPLFQTSS